MYGACATAVVVSRTSHVGVWAIELCTYRDYVPKIDPSSGALFIAGLRACVRPWLASKSLLRAHVRPFIDLACPGQLAYVDEPSIASYRRIGARDIDANTLATYRRDHADTRMPERKKREERLIYCACVYMLLYLLLPCISLV